MCFENYREIVVLWCHEANEEPLSKAKHPFTPRPHGASFCCPAAGLSWSSQLPLTKCLHHRRNHTNPTVTDSWDTSVWPCAPWWWTAAPLPSFHHFETAGLLRRQSFTLGPAGRPASRLHLVSGGWRRLETFKGRRCPRWCFRLPFWEAWSQYRVVHGCLVFKRRWYGWSFPSFMAGMKEGEEEEEELVCSAMMLLWSANWSLSRSFSVFHQ